VPVRGMLCFIDADWPIFGGAFTTGGIDVLWPRKIADKIHSPVVLTAAEITTTVSVLADHFPPA